MSNSVDAIQSLRFERFEVRPRERRLLVERKEATVGARAFDVLLALIDRRDRLVPKSELLDVVWPDTVVEENNLQVHISALRKLLGQSVIATIPGRGYRFTLAPAEDPGRAPAPDRADPARLLTPTVGTNVPAALEALIGRDADVDAVAGLLASHRLVTIVGPGGIGKTRVALEVGRTQVGKRPHGAWWVDLASITAPDRVASTIADAAGTQLGEGDPVARLAEAMAQLDLLLVLDNCEHLIAEVARIAQAIQERAPKVAILATSQAPLKSPAEHVYRLSMLETPDDGSDLDTARRYSAVMLLERRAQAADRRFVLGESNIGAAIAVCRALEGVALAIEMAAARVPVIGVDAVRTRLDDRFRMLSASNRLGPGRHRSLLATLEWSHALLSRDEQVVLRRIGAFAGSFGIDTAKAMAQDAALDEWDVIDALASLVDKSLVHVEQLDPPRYRLLETTRLYALDRLNDAGETAIVNARHASVMAAHGEQVAQDSASMTDMQWNTLYSSDYQDLQVAFRHAVDHGEPHVAAQTGAALRMMDLRRGNLSGLRARMSACFKLISDASALDAARLWDVVMPADQIAIDAIARLDAARNRLAAWRAQDAPQDLYAALCSFADELARAGRFAEADRALQEAKSLEKPEWPLRVLMLLPMQRGSIAMHAKDAAGYRLYRREVLRLAEQCGATRQAISARLGLGDAALLAEDYGEAAELCRAVVDELKGHNRLFTRGIALENLANALVHLGDLQGAAAAVAQSLPIMRQNEAGADLFTILALIAIRSGKPQMAARMLGHVDAWVKESQYDLAPNEARAAEEAGREIDAAIGPAEHARLRSEGGLLSEKEADALAAECFGAMVGTQSVSD